MLKLMKKMAKVNRKLEQQIALAIAQRDDWLPESKIELKKVVIWGGPIVKDSYGTDWQRFTVVPKDNDLQLLTIKGKFYWDSHGCPVVTLRR